MIDRIFTCSNKMQSFWHNIFFAFHGFVDWFPLWENRTLFLRRYCCTSTTGTSTETNRSCSHVAFYLRDTLDGLSKDGGLHVDAAQEFYLLVFYCKDRFARERFGVGDVRRQDSIVFGLQSHTIPNERVVLLRRTISSNESVIITPKQNNYPKGFTFLR